MKTTLKLVFSMLMLTLTQTALAQIKYSSTIQATITDGSNNGTDETFKGLWLSGKASKGLSRNSRLSLNLKVGGQSYDNSAKDKTDINIQANYIYQPSTGYFSPTYSLKFQIAQEKFSTSTTDKNALSFSRYQPISNKMEYGITYRISQESGNSDSDTRSLSLNIDYFHNANTIFYANLIIADEKTSTTITAQGNPNNNIAARSDNIAGGHAPGEPGYHGPALSVGDHSANSDNTSIYLGAVYSIDANQSIDVAFIKHFYDSTFSGSNDSQYLALDYFYKF